MISQTISIVELIADTRSNLKHNCLIIGLPILAL